MTHINYNLKHHLKLLKQKKKILNEKKVFFKEYPKEDFKLTQYDSEVSQHIMWEDRFEIASVMKNFLTKNIDAYEFHDSVFGLWRKHQNSI